VQDAFLKLLEVLASFGLDRAGLVLVDFRDGKLAPVAEAAPNAGAACAASATCAASGMRAEARRDAGGRGWRLASWFGRHRWIAPVRVLAQGVSEEWASEEWGQEEWVRKEWVPAFAGMTADAVTFAGVTGEAVTFTRMTGAAVTFAGMTKQEGVTKKIAEHEMAAECSARFDCGSFRAGLVRDESFSRTTAEQVHNLPQPPPPPGAEGENPYRFELRSASASTQQGRR
jgi:hypothetical protein